MPWFRLHASCDGGAGLQAGCLPDLWVSRLETSLALGFSCSCDFSPELVLKGAGEVILKPTLRFATCDSGLSISCQISCLHLPVTVPGKKSDLSLLFSPPGICSLFKTE